jgi:Tfp pilus assembly ATPase PilU
VIIGLKYQNEQFFSYIKAMKQKEFKAPIIYITVHIPTSIQRNSNLKQKEVT